MLVDAVLLPAHLRPQQLQERTAVVFDVLRATTSITAALAAGVREVRVFGDLEAARAAAGAFEGPKLLCGERQCLRPEGFDLGNSPGDFSSTVHSDRTAFLATTNGTRAIIAAGEARTILVGALLNVSAVAHVAASLGDPVTLVCAGTNGEPAMEDMIGAGAVAAQLIRLGYEPESDVVRMAARLFVAAREDLLTILSDAQGGRNVVAAGLAQDIHFAARLDAMNIVGRVMRDPLRVVIG